MGECLLTSNTVSGPFAERNVNRAHAWCTRGLGASTCSSVFVLQLRLARTAEFGCVREWR